MHIRLVIALVSSFLMSPVVSAAIFRDDFSTSAGAGFTLAAGGSMVGSAASGWALYGSGQDFGARIHEGVLELTNNASAASNNSGWVYATAVASGFSEAFYSPLSGNGGVVSWSFNMRQSQADPSGFETTTSYGTAFLLGATARSPTSGVGYAVVLGNAGDQDPIRLVRFSGGLQGSGKITPLVTAASELNDVGNAYASIKVTYDPANNRWTLYGRNDGDSGFADPATGTLENLGTAIDGTYVGHNLQYIGGYTQGGTSAYSATFDNVLIVPEPASSLLAYAVFPFAGRRRARI